MTAGWHAFNITSDKASGIGGWSDDELFAYLATGHAQGRGTAAGPMGEAVDQSFSQLAPSDIHALVSYVRSVPPIASPDLPATLAPPAPASPKAGRRDAGCARQKDLRRRLRELPRLDRRERDHAPTRQWPAPARSTIAPPPMSPRS